MFVGKEKIEETGREADCGSMTMVKMKRIYEKPAPDDGFRIFVDRLWPRGLSKGKAHTDLWLKEIAPSDGLRKWFSHDLQKWRVFRKKYDNELKEKTGLVQQIKQIEKEKGTVTLLYSAKDTERNNCAVLYQFMQRF